jgi:hypothetical protein
VHELPGRRSIFFIEHLRYAFTFFSKAVGCKGSLDKKWNALLNDGRHVLRISSTPAGDGVVIHKAYFSD